MSAKLMGAVFYLNLTPAQKLVLLALADHAYDDGSSCRPGLDWIAAKVGYSLRQVRRHMAELKRAGLVREVTPPRRHRPAEYALRFPQFPHLRKSREDTGDRMGGHPRPPSPIRQPSRNSGIAKTHVQNLRIRSLDDRLRDYEDLERKVSG